MELERLDKRLQQRLLRLRKLREEELGKAASKLPDRSSNLREPSEEELEQIERELAAEQDGRRERVRGILERGPVKPPITRPEPVLEPEEE